MTDTRQRAKRPPRVLLVDDSPTSRQLVEFYLTKIGCNVTLAEDGEKGCDKFFKFTYDLVFMDCQMPVMDGYEATRRIRRFETSRHTPIVAMTGGNAADERLLCKDAGMDAFCPKPITPESITAVVEKFCGQSF